MTLRSASLSLLAACTLALLQNAVLADELNLPEMKVPLAVTDQADLGTNDDVGLKQGAKVSEFTVNRHTGEAVSFDTLLSNAPLLVVFYRGGWCPYCNVQIHQLTDAYGEFEKRGVTPVLISVDKPDAAALAQRTYEIPFPVLSDPDLKAHEAFDVIMAVDAETVKQYKGFGIDLEAWSERDHHKIAVSSAFLVDNNGVVQWAHTSKDYKTRPSPEQLLSAIDATL